MLVHATATHANNSDVMHFNDPPVHRQSAPLLSSFPLRSFRNNNCVLTRSRHRRRRNRRKRPVHLKLTSECHVSFERIEEHQISAIARDRTKFVRLVKTKFPSSLLFRHISQLVFDMRCSLFFRGNEHKNERHTRESLAINDDDDQRAACSSCRNRRIAV